MTITQEANRLRDLAHRGPIGKRHSSFALYDLLGECFALAKRCREPGCFTELELLVRGQPCAGKGRWVLESSDEYLLVCRYVFPRRGEGRGELANASRYASCLREADKRQIQPRELPNYLKTKGGINALFLQRPLTRTTVRTKTLHLAEQIEVSKDRAFTITLKRLPDNRYEVVGIDTE